MLCERVKFKQRRAVWVTYATLWERQSCIWERKHKQLPGVGTRVGFPTERHRGIFGGVGISLYDSLGGNLAMIFKSKLTTVCWKVHLLMWIMSAKWEQWNEQVKRGGGQRACRCLLAPVRSFLKICPQDQLQSIQPRMCYELSPWLWNLAPAWSCSALPSVPPPSYCPTVRI